ncbi:MAG: quinolinate synthase NadA [Methanobrevibacter sp.]|nr:quinolinate synthase NadA [Methanobrevibacter sp.]
MLNKLQEEIISLKKEKNAIILAHNYQPNEIQEIADFLGDSLELCIKATEIKGKDLVVFCGVDFMAETANILNPQKKIVVPDKKAECPMAHMLDAEEILEAKKKYPNAAVVLYVNSLATAKAEADILCTSANALKVVESLKEDQILFGPDNNLANFVAKQTEKEIIPIPDGGHCYVHKMFHTGDVVFKKERYPNADLIVHPECNMEVQDLADYVLSTGGMINKVKNSDSDEFIIGTELDLITRINREIPEKKCYPLLDDAICKTMKLHTLDKVKNSLENEKYEIVVDDEIAKKSLNAVERMIEVSK